MHTKSPVLKSLSQQKCLVYTSSGTRFPGIPICRQVFPHSERPFLPHFFYYISYVTLPPIERCEEWYVWRFELCNFFLDCSSTSLHPLGLSAGTFFIYIPHFCLVPPFLFASCCCNSPCLVPQPLACFHCSDPSVVFFLMCSRCPGNCVFLRVCHQSSFSLFVCFFFSPLLLCFASSGFSFLFIFFST